MNHLQEFDNFCWKQILRLKTSLREDATTQTAHAAGAHAQGPRRPSMGQQEQEGQPWFPSRIVLSKKRNTTPTQP